MSEQNAIDKINASPDIPEDIKAMLIEKVLESSVDLKIKGGKQSTGLFTFLKTG